MALYTLNNEVNGRVKSPLIIDTKGRRYEAASRNLAFPAPELWVLEKNLFYLLSQSSQINLELKYHMRPSYLSYDEYGTVILGDLLMYVNGIRCIEDFVQDKIMVPSKNSIIRVCGDNYGIDVHSKVNW